ncbi:MAG TPA: hypothetical protein VFY06_01395 [Verrucomicrobiae bacterium]|nr:hypothetical protein [Verrucomicrobiae bacterium]
MSEGSKSIWNKSGRGLNWLRAWLIVVAATFAVILAISFFLPGGPKTFDDWLVASFLLLFVSAIVATIFVGLWSLLRWMFSAKNFRRSLFAVACLATLIALFYAEEDWRGWHDWNQFKQKWEAKGEKFDWQSVEPPPVPDDQNFAMAPIFDATDKLANRKWRQAHQNPQPVNGNWWDTNLVDPLQIDVVDYGFHNGNYPTVGDWTSATMTDLRAWQDYYRRLAATTNEFPVPPQPQTPAQDILLALSKYDSTIQALHVASERPDSRFPLDYDDENPAEILLPHLADLKRCNQVLRLRAIAELRNGQSEKALADVKLMLRLTDSIRDEPFIICQLVRSANFQITLQPIYEGLAEQKWSDAQLADLGSALSKQDFLAGYELAVRGERNAHLKIIDWLEQKRSRSQQLLESEGSYNHDYYHDYMIGVISYLLPKGWFYQNEIALAQQEQQWILPVVDDAKQTVSPKMAHQANQAIEMNGRHSTPFNFLALRFLPALGPFAKRAAYTQASVDLARTAIALERYRLAHGDYPESLDALAPEFIEKVPHDVIGGGPLHYRLTSDGQFVLYSIGWNENDDGGVVVLNGPFGKSGGVNFNQGDWVWRYPQK